MRPTAEDLAAIGLTGYARAALEDLQAKADGDPGSVRSAEVGDALALLYRIVQAQPAGEGGGSS